MFKYLQVIVTVILTVLYAIWINFSIELLDIFRVILIFAGLNIAYTLLILISFGIFIYATEKTSQVSMTKHYFYNLYNEYIFNFLYRVKPIIIDKENLPKDNNFVVYANHIEYTDPFYIKQTFKKYPLTFISKQELFKIPLIRNVLRSIGSIPLSRKVGDRQALEAILSGIKLVKSGQPICIFPEGTRNHANTVKEFKSGSFKLALKAKADISVLVLYNMHKSTELFKYKKARVYVIVLPLVKYETIKDLDSQSLSNHVHQLIEEKLQNFKI